MSTILSARDLSFLLHEWLDVEKLTSRERFKEHSRETFDSVLALAEQIATNDFAPHNASSDRHEPEFDGTRVHIRPEVKEALDVFHDAGFTAGAMDEAVGGSQLPHVVHRACFMWFQAANISTSGYPMLAMGVANLLTAHASSELIDTFVPGIAEGRFYGTMCLSEPDVGSSLADVRTKAIPQPDGSHRLFGTKMWISGGEHDLADNIVHLVLARYDGGPDGIPGLSLYAVPKYLVNADGSLGERNDVTLVGLNHKMGFRGTVNTVLQFGDGAHTPGGEAGATAYLVGEQGKGLLYMFHMMNEARISVGAGAAALGYTGYLHSLAYARSRPQGRPEGESDPTTPMVPIAEHADVRRMLLAQKVYAEGAVALVLYAARLLDDELTADSESERRDAHLLLEVLTPIVKSWPSQWCLAGNDLAIQVHGGYGYTREYPVEQMYRDNRLNPIHEGTHGIQGRDLLGRKVVMAKGAALGLLLNRMRDCAGRASAAYPSHAASLSEACDRLEEVTAAVWEPGDRALAMAHATIYLEAAGHIVVAWMWLELALAAHGETGTFYAGKRLAADYFFAYELPMVAPMLDLIETRTTLLLDLDVAAL